MVVVEFDKEDIDRSAVSANVRVSETLEDIKKALIKKGVVSQEDIDTEKQSRINASL